MKTTHPRRFALAAALLLLTRMAAAHHGSAISYDTTHLWSTKFLFLKGLLTARI